MQGVMAHTVVPTEMNKYVNSVVHFCECCDSRQDRAIWTENQYHGLFVGLSIRFPKNLTFYINLILTFITMQQNKF